MGTDMIFPDNWRDVIKGKKVILYNTGVTSLLQGREKRIEKMRWVFSIFKEHPEVVLWWRPHPLEVSTAHSMLPELEEHYLEARRQYVGEEIGILDESADLNRAIAISDAYYGAWSSVAELYKAAGKPVLYENYKVIKTEETTFLPASVCLKDDFIWFIQLNSNKLVKVSRVTFEVEKIINIDNEPPFKRRLYNYHIIDAGSSLLLLLENSCQIYEYEIGTGIVKEHRPKMANFIFHSEAVIKKNDKLLLFPFGDEEVLEYNCATGMVTGKRISGERIKTAKCHEMIGTKVYTADNNSNMLYQYDTSDDSCTGKRIGTQENRYWGVKKAGNYFVLPHLERRAITLWNEENGEITELTQFPDGYACLERHAYLDMFEKNGEIYIFPFYANMILKVNVENKRIMQAFPELYFKGDYTVESETFSSYTYLSAKRYGDFVWTYVIDKKRWRIFDLNTMSLQESPIFEIEDSEHKKLFEQLLDENDCDKLFCEGESFAICNLENFIMCLFDFSHKKSKENLIELTIGSKIYKYFISEL